ncbi:hypothetical protein G3480_02685 [Thiorhodococcus mannitoliphagus]|uniref:Uncharacterized protein n=1 Tax=Thiorhodococcus mannitoliphagus TaxID=329406 RepID=A0A6P1DMS6_9GAMM|nr:hypothetical protein [Thiorhodococcus mannitoliphagus]NEX19229.1 hypothetical protein [Thiorhodococcus mannitoliphagus]
MANPVLDDILERLRATQRELDQELDRLVEEGRERFRYSLRRGKVVFERNMRSLHRQQRISLWRYLRRAPLAYILTAPLIYGVALPMLILDFSLTLYQQVCFRVYGIPRVRRADFFVIDRHRLAYLNPIEKLNCVYCGYGNQLIEYAREVAGRTEQYWCPIKHAQRTMDPHARVQCFFGYGDADAYRQELKALRRDWDAHGKDV